MLPVGKLTPMGAPAGEATKERSDPLPGAHKWALILAAYIPLIGLVAIVGGSIEFAPMINYVPWLVKCVGVKLVQPHPQSPGVIGLVITHPILNTPAKVLKPDSWIFSHIILSELLPILYLEPLWYRST